MNYVREFDLPRFGHKVQRGGPRAVKVEPKVYLEGDGVRATLEEGEEGIALCPLDSKGRPLACSSGHRTGSSRSGKAQGALVGRQEGALDRFCQACLDAMC